MSKILVAYTTKSGSTVEVAQTIGKVLQQAGDVVEVRRITEVNGLGTYSAVVLVGAKPGDARNWDAICAWAAGERPALLV
jgi:menaquinone-dependent protoporphyrinogen IX oxidase